MWTGNALALGHTVVLMDKWSAEETLRLIAEIGLAMNLEATWDEIEATIHAHPTLAESLNTLFSTVEHR